MWDYYIDILKGVPKNHWGNAFIMQSDENLHIVLATAQSYLRYKNNIFINSGIEIENYEKALEIIKEQLEEMKQGNFTEEEIENAKKGLISGIETINDEQDTQITYHFGQELTGQKTTTEQYKEKMEQVTKEDIIGIANKVTINTIYFLRD